MSHPAVRPSALLHTVCLLLACGLSPRPFLGQERPSPTNTTQKSQSASERVQSLFRIDVEDAIEAGLVEQQLKIRPVLIRDRSLYYYGNEETNEQLRKYGYEPMRTNPEDVLTRVVRVTHKGDEEDLSKAGVTILLREHEYWIVRATSTQLRLLIPPLPPNPKPDRKALLLGVKGRVLQPGETIVQPVHLHVPEFEKAGTTVVLEVNGVLKPLVPGKRVPVGNGYTFEIRVQECKPAKSK